MPDFEKRIKGVYNSVWPIYSVAFDNFIKKHNIAIEEHNKDNNIKIQDLRGNYGFLYTST
jgi:hypothetical protein